MSFTTTFYSSRSPTFSSSDQSPLSFSTSTISTPHHTFKPIPRGLLERTKLTPLTMSFSGKTAIVTGGCGGLGAAITTAFLDAGANVVAVDINADLIKGFGEANNKSTLLTHQADISDEAALDKLYSEAISKFGQVDILINNAGIMDRFEPVGELDKSYWDRVLNVNLTAPYMTSKRLANHVQEKGHKGAIVNVSSLAGTTGWAAGKLRSQPDTYSARYSTIRPTMLTRILSRFMGRHD